MANFEKFNPCCSYEPPSKYHDGYTGFELINELINKCNEVIEYMNGLQGQIDSKEDSDNITNNRKLSEKGDFTGTWHGKTITEFEQRIVSIENDYNMILEWINSNPEFNLEIIDGGFYTDGLTPDIIDCGDFTTAPDEEIDCGQFVYPCQCA